MIRINLIAEGKKQVAPRARLGAGFSIGGENAAIWAVVVSVALVAVVYGGYWLWLNRDIAARDVEIADAQQKVDELQEIIAEVELFTEQKAELQHQITVISDLRDNQRGPVRIMDEVSKGLPDLLWLDELTLTARAVTIRGRSFTNNSVASFIENLDRVSEFQEPVLKSTTWDGKVYSFQIVFNYQAVPIRSVGPADPAVPAR